MEHKGLTIKEVKISEKDIPKVIQEIVDGVNEFINNPTRGTIFDISSYEEMCGDYDGYKLDYYWLYKKKELVSRDLYAMNWILCSNVEDGTPAYIYNEESDSWFSRPWMTEREDQPLKDFTVASMVEELIMFIAP